MATFIGTTSSSATYTALTQPASIVAFSIANKTGGGITVSVGILQGSTFYVIYNKSLATGESYVYTGNQIPIPTGYQIYVSSSGSCDYIFNIQ